MGFVPFTRAIYFSNRTWSRHQELLASIDQLYCQMMEEGKLEPDAHEEEADGEQLAELSALLEELLWSALLLARGTGNTYWPDALLQLGPMGGVLALDTIGTSLLKRLGVPMRQFHLISTRPFSMSCGHSCPPALLAYFPAGHQHPPPLPETKKRGGPNSILAQGCSKQSLMLWAFPCGVPLWITDSVASPDAFC